jgi:hypothetical protein
MHALSFQSVNTLRWMWLCSLAVLMVTGEKSILAGPALQYHCVGSSQLTGRKPPTALQRVLGLHATTNFQNIALTKFSRVLTNSLLLAKDPGSASLIAPLLSDLVENESLGCLGAASINGPSFILAVHLNAPRTQLWQENAGKIFASNGEEFKSQEFSGRRWNASGLDPFWILPVRDWLLVGHGRDFSPMQADYLNQIKIRGRPAPSLDQNWLEADLASADLGGWFRYLKPANLRITIKSNGENLQFRLQVSEAEAIPWQSEPWQFPKDLIHGQIISYTAGQNVAALLNLEPALSQLPGSPLTNQFYFWALDQMPMLNYMAWPQADASNALERIATEAPGALNPGLKRFNGTELVWRPETHNLSCLNMRMFVPTLEALQCGDGQYLFLSTFPRPPGGKPAPDALLAQVQGRTNLVYYDWESTGRRLLEWQILRGMIANRALPQGSEAVDKSTLESEWLSALAPLAGNTVTEITRVTPKEFSAVRTAPLGFTAVELALLADWICDANSGPIHSPPPAPVMAPPKAHPKNGVP